MRTGLFAWLGLLLMAGPAAFAQQRVQRLPVPFHQLFRAFPLVNPAALGTQSPYEGFAANQRHGGPWSDISTFYANGAVQLGGNDAKQHVVGLKWVGDREGQFLSRNRFYGQYAYHTRLTEQTKLGAGAGVGAVNFSVEGTAVSGNGSDFAPDAELGLWLYSPIYQVGASFNQALGSSLQPLEEITDLQPHANFTAGYRYSLNAPVVLRPVANYRVANNARNELALNALFSFDENFTTGLGYRHQRGVTFFAGVDHFEIGNGSLDFMFSYHLPFGFQDIANVRTYEISLRFRLWQPAKGLPLKGAETRRIKAPKGYFEPLSPVVPTN